MNKWMVAMGAAARVQRECETSKTATIAFEGIDGAGLSTHSKLLAEHLRSVLGGARVIVVKEPSQGPVGRLIRGVLGGGVGGGLASPQALALLFAADRLGHLLSGDLGVVVGENPGVLVLDRYKYSSIVYQSSVALGSAEPPPQWWVELVNAYAPPPHVLVYLRVEPEEAWHRIQARGKPIESYETLERLKKLADAFDKLIRRLDLEGETLVEWGTEGAKARQHNGGEPLWTRLLPPCVYPPGRYPRVVTVDTTGRSIEETAKEVAEKVVRELERLGLVEAREEGQG